ncbi:MAG: hypothetical protein M3245_03815, partial [Actinomycetota bacterium]|nr:hypothetical protein [Actinomycetota bacterium]
MSAFRRALAALFGGAGLVVLLALFGPSDLAAADPPAPAAAPAQANAGGNGGGGGNGGAGLPAHAA